jgi:mono/diheme cytochrome c family protein
MFRVWSVVALFLVGGLLWSQSGEPFKPGKLPNDEQAALVPGLTLRFSSVAGGQPIDVRRSRLAAIHVPEGTPASPFLKPGPFTALIRGYVKTPLRSDYQFQIAVKGIASLRVNGKVVLGAENETKESEPVELARGFNKIEINYTSPKEGDATLRVSWVSDGFNLEPLPPDALFSRGDDADLVARSQVREGRLTFATHGCHRCHALPDGVAANKDAMPELQQQPPSLEGAGSRFGPNWLAKWILNPRSFRPQSTMPALLHGETAPQDAADIAAYLGTLKTDIAAPAEGEIEKGEKLFRTLGCMACHHFGDPKEEDPFDRLPLTFIHEKLQPASLFSFLMEPHRHYGWSRMPDFKLSREEADHLAAYVTEQAKGKLDDPPAGDAKRGEELFSKVGCANCHVLKTGTTLVAKNLLPFPKNTTAGCLADDAAARKNTPDYGFAKGRLAGVREFLKSHGETLSRETAAEFSLRQVAAMKCTACHRRDGGNSRWFQVMEEEGTLPEFLPLLTWAGEKLQPAWTQKLLSGGIDHRARPWLKARMPAFPARADLISLGLTHEHGFGQKESDRPPPDAALAELGKKLLPQMGGLNCIQCHGVGKTPPVAPFEAPGINLLDAAHRLRYSYYQRWMLDPPRLDPTTKMVKLAPDGKTTGIREVFDGDARKQFDALWQYIQTLPTKDEK